MTQGLGQPDASRAARYVLKDYVNGKLPYVEPPPGIEDAREFNRELYDLSRLPVKRKNGVTPAMAELSVNDADDAASLDSDMISLPGARVSGAGTSNKSQTIDKAFFKAGQGSAGHLSMPFNYRYTQQGMEAAAAAVAAGGKQLSGRKLRAMIALEQGVDPKEVQMGGKKHFKGGPKAKRGKNRGNTMKGDARDDE
jgi:large subunit GTPase 1